jgi:predicted RNase H-like nuclease (RuvC/YqgF family)
VARYLIVGLDAGIKTGYAILDLHGALIASGVEKEASDERIVRLISGSGIPLLIASDTRPPSHFVQKTAARLNIRVFHPKESMSREEKRIIGREIADPHIRDAYAAAVKAFRHYQNRLRQIEASDHPDKEELKRRVLTGRRAVGSKGRGCE